MGMGNWIPPHRRAAGNSSAQITRSPELSATGFANAGDSVNGGAEVDGMGCEMLVANPVRAVNPESTPSLA